MEGYHGCGSRGLSKNYPSRDAASLARSSATKDEELRDMIIGLLSALLRSIYPLLMVPYYYSRLGGMLMGGIC